MHRFNARLLLNLFVLIAAFTVSGTADDNCGACGQNYPPPSSPPPPSPPPPCPPSPPPPCPPSPPPPCPPSPPPPCPPPLAPKYCRPPCPPSLFIPGTLYPVDPNFNGATQNSVMRLPAAILVACGLLGLLAFW